MSKFGNNSMKVITVNIPKAFIKHIDKLRDIDNINEFLGYEPSRSEVIRHALKDYIVDNYELWDFLNGIRPGAREARRRELNEQLETVLIPVVRAKKIPLGRYFEDYKGKGMNEE